MEGFLIELRPPLCVEDEEDDDVIIDDMMNVEVVRRYAMLEKDDGVLILSGRVGEAAERLYDLKDLRILRFDVMSFLSTSSSSGNTRRRRFFKSPTNNLNEWIKCIQTYFSVQDETKEDEVVLLPSTLSFEREDLKSVTLKTSTSSSSPDRKTSPPKQRNKTHLPSTPDLRRTLQKSLQDMKSAVIDAATTTSIPKYEIVDKETSLIETTPPHFLNSTVTSKSQENLNATPSTSSISTSQQDLIALLLRKEEQIKRLQEMGRRQKRQYRAARQKERQEILNEVLRLKSLHRKQVDELLEKNQQLSKSLKSKELELIACRKDVLRSEMNIDKLESRVLNMELKAVAIVADDEKPKKFIKKKKKIKKKARKKVMEKENINRMHRRRAENKVL